MKWFKRTNNWIKWNRKKSSLLAIFLVLIYPFVLIAVWWNGDWGYNPFKENETD